jgi:hypothetical protein
MLAAMLPIPYDVQPLAAMMAPAAPRVCAAIDALKSGVSWSERASRRGVVPIAALDHAIYLVSLDFAKFQKADSQTDYLHAHPVRTHQYCSAQPQPSAPVYLVISQSPNSFQCQVPDSREVQTACEQSASGYRPGLQPVVI